MKTINTQYSAWANVLHAVLDVPFNQTSDFVLVEIEDLYPTEPTKNFGDNQKTNFLTNTNITYELISDPNFYSNNSANQQMFEYRRLDLEKQRLLLMPTDPIQRKVKKGDLAHDGFEIENFEEEEIKTYVKEKLNLLQWSCNSEQQIEIKVQEIDPILMRCKITLTPSLGNRNLIFLPHISSTFNLVLPIVSSGGNHYNP